MVNPKVDSFIRRSEKWPDEMTELRPILLSCGLVEEFKWGKPCYTCGASELRDHVPDTSAMAVQDASPKPAPSSWARPISRCSQVTPELQRRVRPDQEPMGSRTNRGSLPAAQRPRWPQDSSLSRSAATSAAPSAYRHTSAASTVTSRRTASSRCADTYWVRRGHWRLPTSSWPTRWRAHRRTSALRLRCWPVPTH